MCVCVVLKCVDSTGTRIKGIVGRELAIWQKLLSVWSLTFCFSLKNKCVLFFFVFYYDTEGLSNLVSSSIVQLERTCLWWEHFSQEYEAFSLSIRETEKELEALSTISSSESLDKPIRAVEVCVSTFSIIFALHCSHFHTAFSKNSFSFMFTN